MITSEYSVAIDGDVARALHGHLIRADRQEDLCFALWRPSTGRHRKTALLYREILPQPGERRVHGNASFTAAYFERVIGEALAARAGVAFLHSHPCPGWQDMSNDDIDAEREHAGATFGATRLPLVGLTTGSDGTWSARFWERSGRAKYQRQWCRNVRTVATQLRVDYSDNLCPPPGEQPELERTIHAWGEALQARLARLRVGVVGLGSVGALIAESLARTGIEKVLFIDFDHVEMHNLDRLLHATRADARARRRKVELAKDQFERNSVARAPFADAVPLPLQAVAGYEAALDCDVLFSCVDRPLPRHLLNLIAHAHLIPVIDGGILVRRKAGVGLLSADWRAHITSPLRRCLACIGQYDPGEVELDRRGLLDDPKYLQTLPEDHPLRTRENVFGFSTACASQMFLQFIQMIVAPLGIATPGRQLYHFVPGMLDTFEEPHECDDACLIPKYAAAGDAIRSMLDLTAGAQTRQIRWWERLWKSIVR